MGTPVAPDAPKTLQAVLGLTILGGLIGVVAGVSVVSGGGLTGREAGGLVGLLILSLLPAALAWFTLKGYLLAYVVLIVSSALTLGRESSELPDLSAVLLVPIAAVTLVCLVVPVSTRWIRAQQP